MDIVPKTEKQGKKRPVLTHPELVPIAARWLRSAQRCYLVLAEMSSGNNEVPDAIGWKRERRQKNWSVLVECKATRPDFHSEWQKGRDRPHRTAHDMGQERYYLTPPGLLDVSELHPGWGLLETDGRHVTLIAPADKTYCIERHARESTLLIHTLHRVYQDKLTRFRMAATIPDMGFSADAKLPEPHNLKEGGAK